MKKIAIFPGTFDPFTIGHESLIRRGLSVVDEIVVAIGVNDTKKSYFPLDELSPCPAVFPDSFFERRVPVWCIVETGDGFC